MEKVKILKQTAAALMIAAISFTGCKKDDPVKVSGVSLNKTTLELTEGGSETLTATITPADAENKAVTWTSDKPDVATVADGKVTAVKAGTATITVTTADGAKTATCAVTVKAAYEPVNPMILTTAISGEIEIQLAGMGTAIIDWGDGTEHEMVTLTEEPVDYYHNFTGTTSRTITIDGQNITHLHCGSMLLTAIDVSKNTALTWLRCSYNQIMTLDVTKNTALTFLNCEDNQLTTLDVSKNTGLTNLRCFLNQLTSLDLTNNTALTYLDCGNNQFTVEGLNTLFGTLHGNAGNKYMHISGNPGTDGCNKSIATAKGWRVVE